MMVMLSAGIAPGLALLTYFYLKDHYETEPMSVVIKSFLFGAFLVFPIMFLEYILKAEQVFWKYELDVLYIDWPYRGIFQMVYFSIYDL